MSWGREIMQGGSLPQRPRYQSLAKTRHKGNCCNAPPDRGRVGRIKDGGDTTPLAEACGDKEGAPTAPQSMDEERISRNWCVHRFEDYNCFALDL